jgi:glutamine amidotransferase-like uncharacterized protein
MCSIDCADGVCDVLNGTGRYEAKFIGPSSYPKIELTEDTLRAADCLVLPGGLGDADQFDYSKLESEAPIIKNYVASGGKYLGICMGSYFAGHHYLDILAKSTQAAQYVRRKNCLVTHEKHDVVELDWGGEKKFVYFHDGAAFVPKGRSRRISGEIVARYTNGDAAALIQRYKKGRVGVIGPHPEAQKWWFYSQTRIRDRWHDCIQHDLLLDFVEKLLSSS